MNKSKNKTKKYACLALTGILCLMPVLIFAANPASVTTYGVRNIGMTSANLRGFVSDDGGCAKMTAWFEYGATSDYGQTTEAESRSGIGYFSDDVYDLTPCAVYHFRALAKNNTKQLSYGSDKTFKTQCASFDVNTSVKNLTRGDEVWYSSLNAAPGDELLYRIELSSTGDVLVQNVMLASDIPNSISYEGGLTIDGKASQYNLSAGSVNLGNLFPLQTKILTFKAKVGKEAQLNFGKNELIHSAVAYSNDYSDSAECKVYVNRAGAAGAATATSLLAMTPPTQLGTGVGNDIFRSVLLPFVVALVLVWVFKSKLICFEKWAHKRRVRADQFRTKRKLAREINKLKQ